MRALHQDAGSRPVRNLAMNPSMVSNITGWTTNAVNSTTSHEPTVSRPGSPSLGCVRGTTTVAQTFNVQRWTGAGDGILIRVTPGVVYTSSAWVRVSDVTSVRAAIRWRDSTITTEISVSNGEGVTPSALEWVRLSVTATAPANAVWAHMSFNIYSTNMPAGGSMWVDDAMFTEGPTLHPYGDGGSYNWRWDGVAGTAESVGYPESPNLIRNLVSVPVPSSANREYWGSYTPTATVTQSYTTAAFGLATSFMRVTFTAAPTPGQSMYLIFGNATSGLPVVAGRTYTIVVEGRPSWTTGTRAVIEWWTAAGVNVGSVSGTTTTHTAGRVESRIATGTAPANTAYMKVIFQKTFNNGAEPAIGDTFDAARFMAVEGTYTGSYSDGSTPGWRWMGTPGASMSEGYPYTLEGVAGGAPAGMNTGAQTTQVAPPHALSARTGYVVWDITGFADNFSALLIMGDAQPLNGSLRVQTSVATTGTAVATRVDTVGGSVNVNGGSAPTGRTIGRHVSMVTLREGATHVKFRHDGGSLQNGNTVTPGSGIPGSNFTTVSAGGGFTPVVAYQYFAEHDDATSAAVMKWLANAYGVPI